MIKDTLLFALVFASSLLLTALFESRLIPAFSRNAAQPIYEGGPAWHMKKSGTPTMGGIGFLLPVMLIGFLYDLFLLTSGNREEALLLFTALLFALLNALIGLLDDLTKLRHKENKGLSAKEKLFLQIGAVALFLFSRRMLFGAGSSFFIFGKEIELGAFYYPLIALMLTGLINFANLTDGIDGLASTVAFSAGIALFYVSFTHNASSAAISAMLIGSTVGFLIFNIHPAKIFMGDTGSLFLGALVAVSALDAGGPLTIVGAGIVYILEGASVIIQVLVFKLTKKRVFKMAPLHHHLEKSGWSENKICISAILLTLLSSFLLLILPSR